MIRRECTTLAAAANSRLLICPLLGAGCSLAVERIGNVHNVRPTILSQVRAAASPDESAGGLAQHCDPQFPAETPVISAIARGAAAGQLCADDANRLLRDASQAREADRPRADDVARRI